MLNNYIEKAKMYITSLWFLFLLIFIITVDVPLEFTMESRFIGFGKLIKMNVIPCISLFFLFWGLFFVYTFNENLKGSQSSYFVIDSIRNKNYEHLTFLTTYIIPLICFDLSRTRYVIVLFILLSIIGVIYIRTDMFYANPTLAIMGYQLYEADVKTRSGVHYGLILISRDKIDKDSNIVYQKLDDKIYFIRRV